MIRSYIGGSPQKLIYNIAMSSMKLNPIEACFFCQFYAFLKLIFNYFNVFQGHFLGHWELLILKIPNRLSDGNRRGSPRFLVVILEGMCDSSSVEYLQEENSSFCMYFIQYQLPSLQLLSIIETGCSDKATTSQAPGRCLSQHQTCSCPLSIVLSHQLRRDTGIGIASLAGQCCQKYPIPQGQVSQSKFITPIFLHNFCQC